MLAGLSAAWCVSAGLDEPQESEFTAAGQLADRSETQCECSGGSIGTPVLMPSDERVANRLERRAGRGTAPGSNQGAEPSWSVRSPPT
jgi:hypothetical protein